MKGRRLIDEVSVSELRQMRESGMSNRAIAESLDVTPRTIWMLIGAQPSRTWGRDSGADATPMPRKPAEAAPVSPALTVANRLVYLEGAVADYTVDTKSRTVLLQVKGAGECMAIGFDDIGTFCLEIQAIQRQLETRKDMPEVW